MMRINFDGSKLVLPFENTGEPALFEKFLMSVTTYNKNAMNDFFITVSLGWISILLLPKYYAEFEILANKKPASEMRTGFGKRELTSGDCSHSNCHCLTIQQNMPSFALFARFNFVKNFLAIFTR